MAHLSETEMINWMALYTATGLCCAIATVLAILVVARRIWRENAWANIRTGRDAVMFLPRTWWRWQRLYLLSKPVTLAIVSSFAFTMSWS